MTDVEFNLLVAGVAGRAKGRHLDDRDHTDSHTAMMATLAAVNATLTSVQGTIDGQAVRLNVQRDTIRIQQRTIEALTTTVDALNRVIHHMTTRREGPC